MRKLLTTFQLHSGEQVSLDTSERDTELLILGEAHLVLTVKDMVKLTIALNEAIKAIEPWRQE